jgi:enamine deaminase RidA (YjgF/YER057c/UK114 family)
VVSLSHKRGLGLIHYGGKLMAWGKGAIANDLVFLSGVEARDEKTDIPVLGIKAQTELALNRVKERLEEAGTSTDNVVKFVWYLADRALEQEFYDARDGWLARHAPKLLKERSYASTLLIVGLARYDMLVEIDCIAVLPSNRKR